MAYSPVQHAHRPDMAALRHPLFWGCLGVLVVNDHLLKGAGLLPGWMTGKLSDFAGLLVAPVLAIALLGARSRLARLASAALPVLPFVAINVSPVAARGLEAAMGAVGVPWQIWTDPTDLLALAMLPVALRLTAATRAASPRPEASRGPWVERAAMLLGAVACVATSAPDRTGGGGTWTTDAFVLNQSGAVDLRIRWVTGAIACDLAESRVAETFARDAFDEGVTFHLEQGDTIPLDRAQAAAAVGFDAEIPASSSACDAVLLQVEGMPNTVAFWQRTAARAIQPNVAVGLPPGDGAVILQRVVNDDGMPIGATTTAGIVASPLVDRLEPEQCLGGGDRGGFAWSETAQGTGIVQISSLDRGPDGCYAMTLSESEDLPSFFFVCVPAEAFPFEAGDTIEISHLTALDQRSLRLSRAGSAGRPRVELLIYSGVTGIDTGTIAGNMVDTECVGDRLDCGGFAIPGAFQVTTSPGGAQTIVSGGSDEVDVPGSRVTVMVGRVERIVLAHPDCTAGRDTLGIRGDVLISTEED